MNGVSVKSTNRFLIIYLVSYFGLSVLAGLLMQNLSYPALMLVSEGCLVFPVAVFLLAHKVSLLQIGFMTLPKLRDMLMSYIFAYALMPLIYLFNVVTMTFTDNQVNGMMGELYEYNLPVQLFFAALMPAAVEELIFRGVFYTSYRKRNISGAALFGGLIFGMIHLNLNQFAYAAVIGVAFAFLLEATGSIVNSMTAHFAINANSVLLLYFYKQQGSYEEYMEMAEQTAEAMQETGVPFAAYAVLLAFAAGGLAAAVCIIRGMARRNGREEHMRCIAAAAFRTMQPGTERFFDVWSVSAVVLAFAYMIAVM